MSPTAAEARRVLREHGREVGNRGGLSAAQWEEYESIVGGADGGEFVTDIGDPAPSTPADASSSFSPGPGVDEEQPPRRVRTGGSARERIRDRWANRDRGAAPPPKRSKNKNRGGTRAKRPERPWVPTAGLIENAWERMAQAASGIPPLQRVLAAQGAMAGDVLQGALRDTLVDRFLLQPAARVEQKSEAVAGTVGVPVMVLLLCFRGQALMAEGPDGQLLPKAHPDGSPVWTPATELTMVGPLRYCLMSWLSVSERYAADVIERAEGTIRKGAEADKIIAWIFSAPQPGQSFADVQDEAREHAERFTAPPRPPGAYPQPGGTAFRPTLTASVLPS